MSLGELFSLLQKILTTREVIVVTIVIALYVNLVMYVVRTQIVPGEKTLAARG